MPTYSLAPVMKQRFFDANGNPLAGGKVYTYQANTSTPQATYSSSSGGLNANPVELDPDGWASIWFDVTLSYKVVVTDADDNPIIEEDNIIGLLTNNAVATASMIDDCVTQAKIADDAVGASQLQDDASVDGNRAVTTDHIRDSAITVAKMGSAAITPVKLHDSAKTRSHNVGISASVSSSALTVALKGADGNDPSSSNPVYIEFRNSTAGTGTPVIRSVTGALSVVVSSGSTLGHASAVDQYVYVYALDNSGTVELAVSGQPIFDEYSLVTTTAEGGAGASDSGLTLYSTTARTTKPIKFLARLKSNQATAGTWSTAIAEISLARELVKTARSLVIVHTGNGHGATATKIRRFTTTQTSQGSAITFADAANPGSTFTINEDGIYAIGYSDIRTGGDETIGISNNASSLTTAIASATASEVLSYGHAPAAGVYGFTHWVGPLRAGDVVRAHTQGNANGTTALVKFSIAKIRD